MELEAVEAVVEEESAAGGDYGAWCEEATARARAAWVAKAAVTMSWC